MNETELLRRSAAAAGIKRAPARRLLRAMVGEIRRQLMGGYTVTIWNLGTFKVRSRAAKTVEDFSGRRRTVPDRYVAAFKMSPSLQRQMRGY